MTEKDLIDFLSEESDKMDYDLFENKNTYDTDICGWQEVYNNKALQQAQPEPVRFRIRTIENHRHLTRSISNQSHLSTISSSNESRNVSPGSEGCQNLKKTAEGNWTKKKKPSFILCQKPDEIQIIFPVAFPINSLKIHKPPRPRKQRKPIKIFKLPKVDHSNDE
ncbi:hypothetical protein SteCoe_27424 [Stentor coeruleus]|uniref:Uncharacterized protein n=1 Tax=Stentor coeruleus TaxID=5963 RepID=A0A1R2BAI7_9CILI|nr:hypothetical protein SteCoe_27424 [Stentor coeruleus]